MAKKPFVIDSATGQEVPFLRGVLVQSLVAVGLSFTEAYGIAQRVRELLDESEDTCDTARLRKLVADEIMRRIVAPFPPDLGVLEESSGRASTD